MRPSQAPGRSQGIGNRLSSPRPPPIPVSAPAKTMGAPGSVNSSASPASYRSGSSPTTVMKRGVSWVSSEFIPATSERHGIRAAASRIARTTAVPASLGTPYPVGTPRKCPPTSAPGRWSASQLHTGRVNQA